MILYLYGDNSFAIAQQLRAIGDKYRQKVGSEGDFDSFDLAAEPLEAFLMNLASVPMFASSRLIFAHNISKSKIDAEQLGQIVDSTPDSTNLVLIDTAPDKRTSVFKKLSKLGGAKQFASLPPYDLPKWVVAEAKKLGSSIDAATARYLIDYVGKDQWLLHSELQKLSAAGKQITKQRIGELSPQSIESSAFVLAEALVKKDLRTALESYELLRLQGHADQMIQGAIIYQYRMILLALLNDSELNKQYGAYGYPLQKASQLARGLSLEDVRNAYSLIAEADIATKSGELASSEAMRDLMYKLCG